MILIIGFFYVVAMNDLDMFNPYEFKKIGVLYYEWLDSMIDNSLQITGDVVKLEWMR